MKQKLKEVGKKIASTVLMPAILAGAIAISPKKIHAEEVVKKPITVTIEDKFYNESTGNLENDKTRTTIDTDLLSFRLDKNQGRQSQYMIDLRAVKGKKTKVTFTVAGDIKEKQLVGTYAFGGALFQDIGYLPVFGKSTMKLVELNSLKKDAKSLHKGVVGILGENFDAVYQLTVDRQRKTDSRYYVAFHDQNMFVSLGKTKGNQLESIIATLSNVTDIGVYGAINYDFDRKALSVIFFNTYKNPDVKNGYTLPIARLGADLFTLGTLEIKFPILTDYLTFGDITHRLDMNTAPGKFEMSNQFGMALSEKLGVGAGVTVQKNTAEQLKLKGILAAYFKPRILGQDFYLEAKYINGTLGGFASTCFKF